MSWNADFSVQIFSQEHFMKIVVGLPSFVDNGSDFQEVLILEISKNIYTKWVVPHSIHSLSIFSTFFFYFAPLFWV